MKDHRRPAFKRSVATGVKSEKTKAKYKRNKNRCTYTHVSTYRSRKENREEVNIIQVFLNK